MRDTVHFLDQLVIQLSSNSQPSRVENESQSPLTRLTPDQLTQVKPLVLTLHCLFPDELLLALDLLDRGLVRRLASEEATSTHKAGGETFFVTSSTASPPGHQKGKSYEVRLQAWNCTCPTFSLLEFRDTPPSDERGAGHQLSPPVCKHLLACVLSMRCPGLFGRGDSRGVSAGELAGLCAGWGG